VPWEGVGRRPDSADACSNVASYDTSRAVRRFVAHAHTPVWLRRQERRDDDPTVVRRARVLDDEVGPDGGLLGRTAFPTISSHDGLRCLERSKDRARHPEPIVASGGVCTPCATVMRRFHAPSVAIIEPMPDVNFILPRIASSGLLPGGGRCLTESATGRSRPAEAAMAKKLSADVRQELVRAIGERYRMAAKDEKVRILDEFVAVTGYHRKHSIRILNTVAELSAMKRRPRLRFYDQAVQEALIVLWEASDRVCGKRLKPLLPVLMAALERHGHLRLDDVVRAKLGSASAATIDRLLAEPRGSVDAKRSQRRATPAIRRSIPVRTFADWKEPLGIHGGRPRRSRRRERRRELRSHALFDGYRIGVDRVRRARRSGGIARCRGSGTTAHDNAVSSARLRHRQRR
jgi:hypothetical protein